MIVGVPGREGNGRAGTLCSRFVLDALRRFGLPSRPAPGTRHRAEGEADLRDYGIDGFKPSLSERLASGLAELGDRKSTRLNSSHQCTHRMPSYAVKKKRDQIKSTKN